MKMRPPDFWYNPDKKNLARLLTPLAQITQQAASLRQKIFSAQDVPLPVLCCGNVTIGGSGKTPLCIELAHCLEERGFRPHFLNRGYGQKTAYETVKTSITDPSAFPFLNWKRSGDEAVLLGKTAPCWSGKNRLKNAKLAFRDGADCLILDDGFQYPFLKKDFNLLVFNGKYGIGNGRVLPSGPLRESLPSSIKRADYAIIVGKDRSNLEKKLFNAQLPSTQINFLPDPVFLRQFTKRAVAAFAGIAFPEFFFEMLRNHSLYLKKTYTFPDHHPYSAADIERLLKISKKMPLLTTEKDAVKFPPEIRKSFYIVKLRAEWVSSSEKEKLLSSFLHKAYQRLLNQ